MQRRCGVRWHGSEASSGKIRGSGVKGGSGDRLGGFSCDGGFGESEGFEVAPGICHEIDNGGGLGAWKAAWTLIDPFCSFFDEVWQSVWCLLHDEKLG